jgi:hypothetical protein
MVQAGFSEGTIIRKIELAQVDFDLSPVAHSPSSEAEPGQRADYQGHDHGHG